jgi:hypothetical protein
MFRYVIGFGEQNVYFNGMAVMGFFWRFLMKTQTRNKKNKNKQNKNENVIEALLVIQTILKSCVIQTILKSCVIQTILKSCVLGLSHPDGTNNNNYLFLSLRFSQLSGCWLILSVYIIMSFDFPFVRLFGVL